MARYQVVNLGCKVNRVESDACEAAFAAAGWQDDGDAEIVVVNTCTVTGEAEKKTRKAVHRALASSAREVVVTGCSAAIHAAEYEAIDTRVRVVQRADLARYLHEALGVSAPALTWADGAEAPQVADGAHRRVPATSTRSRLGIKVQDGCDNACTYCIVHTARGRSNSAPRARVIAQARELAEAGVPEVILTGINLGAYRDGSTGLAALVADMVAELGIGGEDFATRLRISSIEPMDVDADLVELLGRSRGEVCRHLHLPLQSGCSKVLAEMGRPYTAEEFRALVALLRGNVEGISLSTDVIVGFPGETEEDFAETVALCRECGFSRMHVFPYSRREGTPAAARADQVPPEVKSRRAAELRRVGAELRAADLRARKGRLELAVADGSGNGVTESYHEVALPRATEDSGLVPVVL